MSGIADNKGVITIATTNHPDRIDPAIKRAGRLDRLITLERPSTDDLAKIFRHYLTESLLEGVDLTPAAMAAMGRTGADVESYVRRAKAIARRAGRELRLADLLAQIREGHSALDPVALRRIGVHEAGHVVVGRTLQAGGFLGAYIDNSGGVAHFEEPESLMISPTKIDEVICLLQAGRAAQALVFGDKMISSGLGEDSDLARATRLAEMLETAGAGKAGNLYLPTDLHRNMLHVPGLMRAVRSRIDDAERRATDILAANRALLNAIADGLFEHGYLSPSDIDSLVIGLELGRAAE